VVKSDLMGIFVSNDPILGTSQANGKWSNLTSWASLSANFICKRYQYYCDHILCQQWPNFRDLPSRNIGRTDWTVDGPTAGDQLRLMVTYG
jgi:hypothetical protein